MCVCVSVLKCYRIRIEYRKKEIKILVYSLDPVMLIIKVEAAVAESFDYKRKKNKKISYSLSKTKSTYVNPEFPVLTLLHEFHLYFMGQKEDLRR